MDPFTRSSQRAAEPDFVATREQKLELYSLYKQAKDGDCPPSKPRPGMMDQVGRFKHDAWVGLRGKPKEAAQASYCKLVVVCDGGDATGAAAGAAATTPRRMTDPEATPEVGTPAGDEANLEPVSSPPPMPPASPAAEPPANVTGVLYKQRDSHKGLGLSSSGWRTRSFTLALASARLTYASLDAAHTERGRMDCRRAYTKRRSVQLSSGQTIFSFIIEGSQRGTEASMLLAVASEQERDQWIGYINAAVANSNVKANGAATRGTIGGRPSSLSMLAAARDSSMALPPSASALPATVEEDEGVVVPTVIGARLSANIDKIYAEAAEIDTRVWNLVAGGPKDGVTRYAKAPVGSRVAARGEATLPFTAEQIVWFLSDTTTQIEMDDMVVTARSFACADGHTYFDHLTYKGVWPVQARDFTLMARWARMGDGSYVAGSQSIGDGPGTEQLVDAPPVARGRYTRGRLFLGGWCLRPLPEGGCKVSYMVEMDLCGSIPSSIVNAVVTQQALTPAALRTALDKVDPAALAAVAAVEPGRDGAGLAKHVRKTRLNGVPLLRLRDQPSPRRQGAALPQGQPQEQEQAQAQTRVAAAAGPVADARDDGVGTGAGATALAEVSFSKRQVHTMLLCVLVAIGAVLGSWRLHTAHVGLLRVQNGELAASLASAQASYESATKTASALSEELGTSALGLARLRSLEEELAAANAAAQQATEASQAASQELRSLQKSLLNAERKAATAGACESDTEGYSDDGA